MSWTCSMKFVYIVQWIFIIYLFIFKPVCMAPPFTTTKFNVHSQNKNNKTGTFGAISTDNFLTVDRCIMGRLYPSVHHLGVGACFSKCLCKTANHAFSSRAFSTVAWYHSSASRPRSFICSR